MYKQVQVWFFFWISELYMDLSLFLKNVNTVMDLGCANRVRVRKSRTPIALAYAIFSGGFRRIFQKSRTQNRVRKSRRVRKIESSWARFTYAILDLRTRFLLGFYWVWFAYTRSDLRTRFAYAICILDSILRTRLEFLSTAIFLTKLGAIYLCNSI